MPVNQLLTPLNKPKHTLRANRSSVRSISSLSRGLKTNPTTIVTYLMGLKLKGLQDLQFRTPIRILIIFILKPELSTKSH